MILTLNLLEKIALKTIQLMHVFAHTSFYITRTVVLCIIMRGLLCGHG